MISFKGAHFPQDIILMGVRWYLAYPLSYRHVEELMEERGVPVDHATIQRWVVKYSPQLEEALHRRKRPVWVSWRMDETYIRVKGQWYYLYRAVDNSHSAPFFAVLKQFWQSLLKSGGDEFNTDNCLRFNSLFPCPFFLNHNFLQTGRPISGPLE